MSSSPHADDSQAPGEPRGHSGVESTPEVDTEGPADSTTEGTTEAPIKVTLPVARVCLDLPVAHLDRPFDYAVPPELDAAAQPGALVRVRFNGRLVNGWLLERRAESDHAGTLSPLHRVRSVPVLSAEMLALAAAVAERYAGSLADVLRSAVPPRHARAEQAWLATQTGHGTAGDGVIDGGVGDEEPAGVSDRSTPVGDVAVPAEGRPGGEPQKDEPQKDDPQKDDPQKDEAVVPAAIQALAAGLVDATRAGAPAVVLTVPPACSPVEALGAAIRTTLAAGRSVLVVVPDRRDIAVWRSALDDQVAGFAPEYAFRGDGRSAVHVLVAEDGPSRRYRAFLDSLDGRARVLLGTRSAVFAPMPDLGLMVIWDDADPLHAEPHAPGWHAREVLALRAWQTGVPLVVAGHFRSPEAERLVSSGWAAEVAAPRELARRAGPRVRGLEPADAARDRAAHAARMPHVVFETIRDGLTGEDPGPVLVSVPRRGYLPAVACQQCREFARCPVCSALLELNPDGLPRCPEGDDGSPEHPSSQQWSCPHCSSTRLRATVVGAQRTVEELSRAFSQVEVVLSGSDAEVLGTVDPGPRIVVATPGAEPSAPDGYASTVVLDAAAGLRPTHLRSIEETVRRWYALAALSRIGATMLITADQAAPAVQSLVRLDPGAFAQAELQARVETQMPPAVRCAVFAGDERAVRDYVHGLENLPQPHTVRGPVPGSFTGHVRGNPPEAHTLITVSVEQGRALERAVRQAIRQRSGTRDVSAQPVTVRIDPFVGV